MSNWFILPGSRDVAAEKVRAIRLSYPTSANLLWSMLNDVRDKVGDTPLAVAAEDPVYSFVNKSKMGAGLLVDADAAAAAAKNTDTPPANVEAQDWRDALYIDLDALDQLLGELEPLRVAAFNAMDAAFNDMSARQGKPQQHDTTEAVDWSNEALLEGSAATLATSVRAEISKLPGVGLTLGSGVLVGAVVVGALVLLARKL